jgi:serine/threonine protein kinase
MEHLHDKYNSIHRDLKSANILLTMEKGKLRAKVADFGTSRFISSKLSSTDSLIKSSSSSSSDDDDRARRDSSNWSSDVSDTSITMTSSQGTPTHMAPEVRLSLSLSLRETSSSSTAEQGMVLAHKKK